MSKSLNRVELIGVLGKDAETKYSTSGKAITNFSIATSYKYGEKEETTWHDVTLWDGEKLAQYLTKGTKLYVEGRLTTRSYDDKNGNKVYKTFVTSTNIILLSSKQQSPPVAFSDDSDGDDAPF